MGRCGSPKLRSPPLRPESQEDEPWSVLLRSSLCRCVFLLLLLLLDGHYCGVGMGWVGQWTAPVHPSLKQIDLGKPEGMARQA